MRYRCPCYLLAVGLPLLVGFVVLLVLVAVHGTAYPSVLDFLSVVPGGVHSLGYLGGVGGGVAGL